MYYLFILLLISHFAFDFYFQTNAMVEAKKFQGWKNPSFYKHHCIHASWHFLGFILALILFYVTRDKSLASAAHVWDALVVVSLIVALIHLVIDVLKEFLSKVKPKHGMCWFICDQFLHVAIILLSVVCLSRFGNVHVSAKEIKEITPLIQLSSLTLGILLLIKPTSLFVMKFLDMAMCDGKIKHISVTKSHVAKMFDDALSQKVVAFVTKDPLTRNDVDQTVTLYIANANMIKESLESKKEQLSVDVENVFITNNGGKWIGYIERIMIFTLYLLGQFTAIAAVMAIKTAFRFNDLKDDNDSQRSEYIMLGTFSSLFITILVAVLVKHFLSIHHFSEVITAFRHYFHN